MKSDSTMHIISCTDDNYAQHLSVMFTSLLMNMDKNRDVELYVIDGGIEEENKERLKKTIHRFGVPVTFLDVEKSRYDRAVESSHITKAAYYRISIPDLIGDETVKRMIYVDCDALVLEDIAKLWDMDISPYFVAAVEDAGQHERLKKMKISETAKYFNSGLMIIDMDEWRKRSISEKVINFINNNSADMFVFHDQDALNAILYDQWHDLHPRWNAQTHIMLKEKTPATLLDKKRYMETRANPAIVHFCGGNKPWNSQTAHPYARHYFEYLKRTAFHRAADLSKNYVS